MVSSAKRTIKACVFDLGNTLINDFLLSRNAVEDMSRWLQERAHQLTGVFSHNLSEDQLRDRELMMVEGIHKRKRACPGISLRAGGETIF
jgi:predicted HAD superfamily phosphohydrolase YqeG